MKIQTHLLSVCSHLCLFQVKVKMRGTQTSVAPSLSLIVNHEISIPANESSLSMGQIMAECKRPITLTQLDQFKLQVHQKKEAGRRLRV